MDQSLSLAYLQGGCEVSNGENHTGHPDFLGGKARSKVVYKVRKDILLKERIIRSGAHKQTDVLPLSKEELVTAIRFCF